MLETLARWWNGVRCRARDWWQDVRGQFRSWRRPDPEATSLDRFWEPGLSGLWNTDLFGFEHPEVRVYRDGSDLVCEAEERRERRGSRNGGRYHIATYQYVSRRGPAPADVDLDRVRAQVRIGLLTLRLPRRRTRPRRIPVRVG